MQKDLKDRLKNLSKDNLISILDILCYVPEFEKSLKLLVNPSKRDIERTLSSFERWCNSVASNPCSEKSENGLYTTASMLLKSLEYTDVKTTADVVHQMYELTEEIVEYSDIACDINCECSNYLNNIIENNTEAFAERELKKYKHITDIYD